MSDILITGAEIFAGLVAFLHLFFLILEMFLWNKPFGRKIFRLKPDFAAASANLAANQGLYNGFLAAGLVFALRSGLAEEMGYQIAFFFFSCVIIAGVFGSMTVSKTIFYVQAMPAIIGLSLLYCSHKA
jgi:putative membrane protein